jgi:hypothetical protein
METGAPNTQALEGGSNRRMALDRTFSRYKVGRHHTGGRGLDDALSRPAQARRLSDLEIERTRSSDWALPSQERLDQDSER